MPPRKQSEVYKRSTKRGRGRPPLPKCQHVKKPKKNTKKFLNKSHENIDRRECMKHSPKKRGRKSKYKLDGKFEEFFERPPEDKFDRISNDDQKENDYGFTVNKSHYLRSEIEALKRNFDPTEKTDKSFEKKHVQRVGFYTDSEDSEYDFHVNKHKHVKRKLPEKKIKKTTQKPLENDSDALLDKESDSTPEKCSNKKQTWQNSFTKLFSDTDSENSEQSSTTEPSKEPKKSVSDTDSEYDFDVNKHKHRFVPKKEPEMDEYDFTYWQREDTCCGPLFKGPLGHILVDTRICKPCPSCVAGHNGKICKDVKDNSIYYKMQYVKKIKVQIKMRVSETNLCRTDVMPTNRVINS